MKGTSHRIKYSRPPWPLLFLLLLLWQCHPPKKVNGSACSEYGEVKDFSGLDGCNLLIVTEKGEKLLPTAIDDPNFTLQAGQRLHFSYQELPDQMSICMAEDKIVRITCIELLREDDRPSIPTCEKVEKIIPESWLDQLRSLHQPRQIIRYSYKTDGWAYLFTGKEFYLYDCQGTLIRKAASAEACLRGEVTDVSTGVVIYQ